MVLVSIDGQGPDETRYAPGNDDWLQMGTQIQAWTQWMTPGGRPENPVRAPRGVDQQGVGDPDGMLRRAPTTGRRMPVRAAPLRPRRRDGVRNQIRIDGRVERGQRARASRFDCNLGLPTADSDLSTRSRHGVVIASRRLL